MKNKIKHKTILVMVVMFAVAMFFIGMYYFSGEETKQVMEGTFVNAGMKF